MVKVVCVGCGRQFGIPSLEGGFCYTCPCGAQTFEFDGKIGHPASLDLYLLSQKYGVAMGSQYRKDIPHLEYYVGWSDFMDERKAAFMNQLKLAGSISKTDCEECKARLPKDIERLKQALREEYFAKESPVRLAAHFQLPVAIVKEVLEQSKS